MNTFRIESLPDSLKRENRLIFGYMNCKYAACAATKPTRYLCVFNDSLEGLKLLNKKRYYLKVNHRNLKIYSLYTFKSEKFRNNFFSSGILNSVGAIPYGNAILIYILLNQKW